MSKGKISSKTPMAPTAASRIQSHADRASTNQGFKSHAQSAAASNQSSGSSGQPTPKGASKK